MSTTVLQQQHRLTKTTSAGLCQTDNNPKGIRGGESLASGSGGVDKVTASTTTAAYKSYQDRLESFDSWPNKEVSKEALARAGFFYKQHSDVVQCPFCHIEGYQWVAGDDPMSDHRSWRPDCPFVMSSMHHDNNSSTSSPAPEDTCGLYGIEILPNSVPEDEQFNFERLGIQRTRGPSHPDKFSLESRLATFAAWPKSMRQTPEQMAEAGFFYVGVGDQTMCFHCGGGLKDWEASDDPWDQHATWFPRCQYLFLQKGRDYIQQVRQNRDQEKKSVAEKTETKEEAKAESPAKEKDEPQLEGESKTLCKICYKTEVGVVFLPCGHIVACVECAGALKNCPVCRKPLEATVRAFLS